MFRLPAALVLLALNVSPLGAQTPVPSMSPNAAPVSQGPGPVPGGSRIDGRPSPSQNVKIDVAITDTFGTTPAHKVVTMLVSDLRSGRIRSTLNVGTVDPMTGKPVYNSIGINVDATPEIRPDGRVFLILNVQYTPERPDVIAGAEAAQRPAELNESLSALLLEGKSTLISQSADPQSDRKVTLEVTATVVR